MADFQKELAAAQAISATRAIVIQALISKCDACGKCREGEVNRLIEELAAARVYYAALDKERKSK